MKATEDEENTALNQDNTLDFWTESLESYSELTNRESLILALRRFKFFPTIAELSQFFEEYKQTDPYWTPPTSEFEAPHEVASAFNALQSAIGAAAYRSWFRGCQVWRDRDDAIHIKAPDAAKASWIRNRYVSTIENIAQCSVVVECQDNAASRHWPHKGPRMQDAWWQSNERWKKDTGGMTHVMDDIFEEWST